MSLAHANKVVSSESEELILVDAHDRETGYLSKALCHDGDGVLHRAFSVFLFDDDGRLLLQQRAAGKRLWPAFWSNSCCSHPRRNEEMQEATMRRLEQELGMSAELEFVYKFAYQARFGDAGSEHELCWVYLGRSSGQPLPNNTEIAATRWISAAELNKELEVDGGRFTPWLKLEWQSLCTEFRQQLGRYTNLED